MRTLLRGGTIYRKDGSSKADVLIGDGRVFEIAPAIDAKRAETVIDCDNCFLLPGLIDVHVHFREPGAEYKETIATGSTAAAAGGFTTVCTMPNLDPAPFDMAGLDLQLQAIRRDAVVNVVPYGRISRPAPDGAVLSDMKEIAPFVCGFSDDGAGVKDNDLMKEAMLMAKDLGKIIVAHAEDTDYPPEDPRSEWKAVERDLELAAKTGCSYHVCHVSAKETIKLIRQAKMSGIDVTCETAPHYIIFSNENIPDDGRFKMNPPLRTATDRMAIINGIKDGTIDMIATDHAPHDANEKSRGFTDSLNGILGLEAAFPVMYTHLVQGGIVSLEKLISLMSTAPAERFGFDGGKIDEGAAADIVGIDLAARHRVDPTDWKSKGRSTPFEGMDVSGRVLLTIVGGKVVTGDI